MPKATHPKPQAPAMLIKQMKAGLEAAHHDEVEAVAVGAGLMATYVLLAFADEAANRRELDLPPLWSSLSVWARERCKNPVRNDQYARSEKEN